MSLLIKEVENKKELNDFVNLPYQLYKENKYWVPPMKMDEHGALNPEKNPAFEFCKVKLWVAYENGKCVGRIGAIVNPLWIEKINEKTGRFTRPEFINDINIARELFKAAEDWFKKEGMTSMQGPLGFSNLDHNGLLIEGQEWLPSIASDYHFAYYKDIYEQLGFEKVIDWLEFRITFPKELPEKAFKVGDLLKSRYGLRTKIFSSKKELDPYKDKVLELFNKAFSELFGTYPLPEKLSKYYVDKFFPFLNPRYVKLVLDKEDDMVGFIIGLPSLSKAMQKAKGKLLPFGWWHLQKALNKPEEMDLMLTGVKPELQKLGVAALLMNEIWLEAQKDGVQYVETTGMLENNSVAIQMWKSFDHIQHKRKRCFKKMF
jgi:GNAT superfamily N-acetyltransferase